MAATTTRAINLRIVTLGKRIEGSLHRRAPFDPAV